MEVARQILTQSGHRHPNLIGFENWRRLNLTVEGYVGRRDFIKVIAGSAAAWRLAARAQQLAMPVVGFLSSGSKESDTVRLPAFWRGLNETGYVEGRNVASEYRWADHQYDRLHALAVELLGRRVTVIVA